MTADAPQRIAALAWSGQQAQAIALATEALDAAGLSAEHEIGLRVLRAESHLLLGNMASADDDARAAQRLARRSRDPALQARALNLQTLLQFQSGEMNAALAAAKAGAKYASRSGDPLLQALSLLFLGRAQSLSGADLASGVDKMARAGALCAALGQPAWQGRALYFQAVALFRQGQAADAERLANEALALARQSGDLRNQGNTLNLLTFTTVDEAIRLKLYAEALAAYRAVGDAGGQGVVIGNLGGTYQELGLFRRAQRLASEALDGLRRSGRLSSAIGVLLNLAMAELQVGSVDEAVALTAEAAALARTLGNRLGQHQATMVAGRIAMRQGRPAEAARLFARALRQTGGDALSHRIDYLNLAGWAHLEANQPAEALVATRRAIKLYRAQGSAAMDGFDAVGLWWHHREALLANGFGAEADDALAMAYRFVLAGIGTLGDEGLRRNALNKLESRRAVVQAWLKHARKHKLPRAEREAHLAGEANLREPFERLVDTGLRLDEIKRESELHEFLIDEATELSGAERVLLVLETPEGIALAGSLLPAGKESGKSGREREASLLQAITPWLDEARVSRAVTLRHGPDGADVLEQRSCIVAPLIAQRELLGYLYCDIDGAFGRFHAADRDLLAMLASQAAATLANVRHAEGLERKVAERTVEARTAQAQAEQRAGELALINSIQQGVAAKLDFQGIVDLVGDKLREVFGSEDLSIRWWDDRANTSEQIYGVEHGKHLPKRPPTAVKPGSPVERLLQTGIGRYHGSHAEQIAAGVGEAVPGTDWCLSIMAAPIRGTQRVLGMIVIENHEREHAYGDADLRVLTTIGATMGTALENARLFDETQRLLKETEARNAELAVINSIQQGMAAELNFQAIVNLVGDKLREVMHTGDIGIRWFDRAAGLVHYLYEYEHGKRIDIPPNSLAPDSKHYARRHPIVANSQAEQQAHGIELVPGTDASRSVVMMPIIGSDRVLGAIITEDYEHDNAYGETEVRLLSTVAASMGVALENARLFDETQRLLKETEARNSELAVINSIQQGVGAELNFQAIVDLVGDKLREVFATGDIMITWRDEATAMRRLLYSYEHGVRTELAPVPDTLKRPIDLALLKRQPVTVRNRADAAKLGLHHFEGTDESESSVFVPMFSGDRFLGTIILENYERENAFGDAEVRLLSTVAASMGVALENARLFDETQRLLHETERRERESTALGDVGRDLSSTLDLATVMDRIAAHAKELLAAGNSAIFLPDGDGGRYRAIVALGDIAGEIKAAVVEPGRGIIGGLLQSGRPELVNATADDPRTVQIAGTETRGDERLMAVPLLAGTKVQGAMAVWRNGGQPFETHELAFLEGLSRQAAIALHNARLFDETRATLERQTATAEVLQVISGSMADAQPVFERILDSCQRLFGTDEMGVCLAQGGMIDFAAYRGRFTNMIKEQYPRPLAGSVSESVIRTGKPVHVPDAAAMGELHDYVVQLADGYANFSLLSAPMIWQGQGIGTIDIARSPPQPFSDKETELLRTFADQAVIAIQNARLFNETKEALERQTATAEVLQVISASMADPQPVFERIVDSCWRLFGATEIALDLVDSTDDSLRLGARRGPWMAAEAASYPKPFAGTLSELATRRKDVLHVSDALGDADVPAYFRDLAHDIGNLSVAAAPMLWEGRGIGSLDIVRSPPRAFSGKELALLKTFADQAVIAIQNARLFNETQEALEHQTATSEVLNVIAASVDDAQPVFDKIIDSAAQLFPNALALMILQVDAEDMLHVAGIRFVGDASGPFSPESARQRERTITQAFPSPLAGTATELAIRTGLADIPDMYNATDVPGLQRFAQIIGYNFAGLFAPLMWEGKGIGSIAMLSARLGPFSEKQHALLKTFADQAVIAIQNARLFNETQEALERQTATAEVLRVISSFDRRRTASVRNHRRQLS